MGYSGSGYTTDSIHSVQEYLASRWGSVNPVDILSVISDVFSNNGLPANATTYLNTRAFTASTLPKTLEAFVEDFVAFVPSYTMAVQGDQLRTGILNLVRDNLSLESAGFDQATIAAALGDPSLQPNAATFYTDVYTSAFNKFLQEFDYTGPTVNGTLPIIYQGVPIVDPVFFSENFKDFFVKFATVVNPTNTSVNFQEIYEAFFGTGNPEFNSFLANYINSVLYAPGSAGSFLPNENIGDWMKKVQDSYAIALHGSAAPSTSSVGQSFKKVVIIDIILRLIIKMIGTLQKVAAMQSDRLRILTLQQSAYTTLLTQVPVFTQGDGTIFGSSTLTSKDEAQKARDQANNYNQTLSETIRSRRTTVQDDAKVLQSNINQSNDSANDQASTATALLQTLSTLLGAIYR